MESEKQLNKMLIGRYVYATIEEEDIARFIEKCDDLSALDVIKTTLPLMRAMHEKNVEYREQLSNRDGMRVCLKPNCDLIRLKHLMNNERKEYYRDDDSNEKDNAIAELEDYYNVVEKIERKLLNIVGRKDNLVATICARYNFVLQ